MSIRKLPAVLRYVWNHPLSTHRRWARLRRFVQWQLASRLSTDAIALPFVNDTWLWARRGMHAATGNIYTGLQEFDEMSFVLHALRASDLFVDVGANVGTYTLLAAGAVGARCISVEPVEATFRALNENLILNQLEDRAEAHCAALGAEVGEARVTFALDSRNHVVPEDSRRNPDTKVVPMTTLDRLLAGRAPTVIKIDVEGFEPQVLAGARHTLAQPSLLAVIIETNVEVARGASDLDDIDNTLRRYEFQPCQYEGLTRRLHGMTPRAEAANAIYVRSIDLVNERCQQAPQFRVLDTAV